MRENSQRRIRVLMPVFLVLCALIVPACKTADTARNPAYKNVHPHLCRYTPPVNEILVTAWGQFAATQYETAALDFERLIAKGYCDDDIYFGAGISRYRAGDKQKALGYLTRAIEFNSGHFEARVFRIRIYRELCKNAAAQLDADYIQKISCGKPLVCGMYYDKNDLAGCDILEARKKETAELNNP